MNYSILLSKEEQMLRFERMGLSGIYLQPNVDCAARPYQIYPIDAKTAERIYTDYGTGGDSYDEESSALEVQDDTVLNLLEAALEFCPHQLKAHVRIGDTQVKALSFLAGGIMQLIVPDDSLMEKSRTVFAAQTKNLVTGCDAILFITDASALLAYGRGKEKANWENVRREKLGQPPVYDAGQIEIVCRHETEVTARGAWNVLPPDEKKRFMDYMETHGGL